MEVNTGNPFYDAVIEFLGFMTPIAFTFVIYYGLRILLTAKKVQKDLGSLKK